MAKFSTYPQITTLSNSDLFMLAEDIGGGAFETKLITKGNLAIDINSQAIATVPYDNFVLMSTSTTIDASYHGKTILASGTITITLPSALSNNIQFIVRNTDANVKTFAVNAPATMQPGTAIISTIHKSGHATFYSATNTWYVTV